MIDIHICEHIDKFLFQKIMRQIIRSREYKAQDPRIESVSHGFLSDHVITELPLHVPKKVLA